MKFTYGIDPHKEVDNLLTVAVEGGPAGRRRSSLRVSQSVEVPVVVVDTTDPWEDERAISKGEALHGQWHQWAKLRLHTLQRVAGLKVAASPRPEGGVELGDRQLAGGA